MCTTQNACIIISMYNTIKSRVKIMLSNDFPCLLDVRQDECLSRILFQLFLNDLEETLVFEGYDDRRRSG